VLTRVVTVSIAAVLAAVLVVFGMTAVARADGGIGVTVNCQGNRPQPGCTVGVTAPGTPGGTTVGLPVAAQGSSGTQVCHFDGKAVACSLPGYGWLGSNGCYYRLDPTWHPPAGDTADLPPAGEAGAYYDVSCLNLGGTGVAIVWLPAGAPGTAPIPAPAVLGQQATNQLTLTVGTIDASPAASGEQLVNLPTWVWLADWQPVTATAAVPGESVTATARPVSATWTFGDGSQVTCAGPGTPYTAGDSPSSPSPTCGHTYTESSADEPGGVFPVTVTVRWALTWAGGGETGTEPALQATATTAFRVAESQAVNTAPNAAS
jgi:hypothetical protein